VDRARLLDVRFIIITVPHEDITVLSFIPLGKLDTACLRPFEIIAQTRIWISEYHQAICAFEVIFCPGRGGKAWRLCASPWIRAYFGRFGSRQVSFPQPSHYKENVPFRCTYYSYIWLSPQRSKSLYTRRPIRVTNTSTNLYRPRSNGNPSISHPWLSAFSWSRSWSSHIRQSLSAMTYQT
jgi:hypothetical protein